MEQNVSMEKIAQIIKKAHKIKFKNIFNKELNEILNIETQRNGTSIQFILTPFLTTASLLLGQTRIETSDENFGVCCFSSLVAYRSTGKTHAMAQIKTAITELEAYYNVSTNESQLTNPESVEVLMDLLHRIPNMIGFFDEADTFFGTLGRVSKNVNDEDSRNDENRYSERVEAIDRFTYSSLYTAPDKIDYYSTSESKNLRVINPRYSMCILGTPNLFVNMLWNERFSEWNIDGLMQRFLICAPAQSSLKAQNIRAAPKTKISFHAIFLMSYLIHKSTRKYTFSDQSSRLIDDENDKYSQWGTKANNFCDSFLSAMLEKSIVFLIRLCAILKSITTAVKLLDGVEEASFKTITKELENACLNKIQHLPADAFIIETEIVEQAKNLIYYFNFHKLVLSGYNMNMNNTFESALEKLIDTNLERLRKRQYTESKKQQSRKRKSDGILEDIQNKRTRN